MNDGAAFRVLGLSGSLRKGSYNERLLRAAQQLATRPCELEVLSLADVPLYSSDVEALGDPDGVRVLKAAIADADAVLVATPEYNHGIPGVLKNAIDWASRPAGRSPLRGKPAAILTASPGMTGGARAFPQTRLALTAVGAYVLPGPEVVVARVHEKFRDGELIDDVTRQYLVNLIDALREWTERLRT